MGGNTTEHTGIETSKSPRLVGIQHQGGPQKAKRGAEPWGRGEEPREGLQPLHTRTAAKQPPGRPVSRQAAAQQAPGEVLVASKHLNIANGTSQSPPEPGKREEASQ